MAIAEDIGQQFVRRGQRAMPRQIKDALDVVIPRYVKHLAQKYHLSKDVRCRPLFMKRIF